MKFIKITLSLVAFIFGTLVVGVSLSSANQSNTQESCESSSRKIYFGKDILPDHLIYPLLMIKDKARLKIASPEQSVRLQLEYANRRLNFANQLIDKNDKELAFSTLTKSQKYLIRAGIEELSGDFSEQERKIVIEAIEKQEIMVLDLLSSFSESQIAVIEQLLSETNIIKAKLLES